MPSATSDEELRIAASEVVAAVVADPRCSRVTDVLVARGGRTLLHHRPGPPVTRDLFSVTKTVLALVAGVAVGEGLLGIEDPVTAHVPAAVARPELEGQSVAHLLTMRRGAETGGRFDLDEVAVSGGSWAARSAAAPPLDPPGTTFRYDNGAGQLVAEVLRTVTGDLAAYAGDRLLAPLGIAGWTWLRDPTGTPAGPAHLCLGAPDLARLGELLCAEGRWQGASLVDPGWVRWMRTPSSGGGPPEGRRYGAGLWIEDEEVCFGAGWAGQLLLCRPVDGLVVVTQSDPGFSYGPPARDAMPEGWRAPLDLVREHLLRGAGSRLRRPASGADDEPVTSDAVPSPRPAAAPEHRADMFLALEDDPREGGPRLGDERATLTEFLRCQRLTLQLKCEGLDAEQLARRSVEPSTMSLLGLVRHMAEVERSWFRRRFARQDVPRRYQSPEAPDGDFDGAVADPAVVEEAWAAWREEVAFAEELTAATDLSFVGQDGEGEPVSLRELLVHMVEEYARHNGHADLLRERIDGRMGQ